MPGLCAAIMLAKHQQLDQAKLHYLQFRALFDDLDEDAKNADPEIVEQARSLGQVLGA